jgi:hypothetical protein
MVSKAVVSALDAAAVTAAAITSTDDPLGGVFVLQPSAQKQA